ncbi:mitochondrial sodium/calcium exchanger protein-like [Littorina saxatilis]|uniref:Sodium/calcium exchanger membrane region domain-containing protein n=1 Tax=Littorina saxatilis TaxID=31220 RepID=A0AAN9FX24_9CAEN
MGDSDVECRDLHTLNITDICAFVNATGDCQIDEGFINYNEFVYCQFSSHLVPLGVAILFIWWLFLFSGLAVTADDFFCPSLAVISRTLRLSHNIAGVTFLAFGNGAPDIFSAIAAIGSAKAGDAGLAIGALFGAGVFVTTVVVGAIATVHPFDAMQRPFLRDVIFYLGAVFWAFWIMWKKEITTYEAVGFILLYVFYVVVVIVGRLIYQRHRSTPLEGNSIQNTGVDSLSTSTALFADDESSPLLRPEVPGPPIVEIEKEEVLRFGRPHHEQETGAKAFFMAINPIDTEGWSEMRFYGKVYEVFKCPLMLLLKLTVPVVDEEEEDMKGWNRTLNSLQCFTGPTFAIFATDLAFNKLGGVFPVYGLVISIGGVLSIAVFCTSSADEPPKYHAGFAYLGFLVAVIWIYSMANEIVNILQMFGIVFNISNAIIGLTLLAWGNSIGDLIADLAMARQGYPRMGISACFGGPLFNLLLGIGIPFTIACIKNNGTYHLQVTLEEMFLAGGVAVSLISSLLIVPLSKFHMSRGYGVYLLILYIAFLAIALLIEINVIKNINH